MFPLIAFFGSLLRCVIARRDASSASCVLTALYLLSSLIMSFRTQPGFRVPELSKIRETTQRVFNKRPCASQTKACEAVLRGTKNISYIRTGLGKTLTFFMPLLFVPNGIQIIVTPLNVLGKQNVEALRKEGIEAIAIDATSATPENFVVRLFVISIFNLLFLME